MAGGRSPQSFQKRQRELQKQRDRQAKIARRKARKAEREAHPNAPVAPDDAQGAGESPPSVDNSVLKVEPTGEIAATPGSVR